MDPIEAALAALELQDSPNYTATAKEFGINRTTLSRRHRGLTAPKGVNTAPHAILSYGQRKTLSNFINDLTLRGIPPTSRMVARFAEEIGGKPVGKNWVARFIKASKKNLASGFLVGFDLNRKKAS